MAMGLPFCPIERIHNGEAMEILKAEAKKMEGKSGVEAYLIEDSDEDYSSDDTFEDAKEEGAKTMMSPDAMDPSKLVDMELVKLLCYCNNIEPHQKKEEY